MKIITFLSDFGLESGYVAQMKGVVTDITNAKLIDISHEITPHNIIQGAYVLRTVVPYYPKGTVHVAVVDPGVGTDRKGIIVVTKNNVLIGPDNGLLIPAAKLFDDFVVYEIKNKKYMNKLSSNTFHGRDIFSPVAAHIINGVSFDEIGFKTDEFVDLDFGFGILKDNVISGKIINIDRFGNIITNISSDLIFDNFDYGKNVEVKVGVEKFKILFVKSYGFVKKGEMLCTIGSSDFFEIGVNQGNVLEKISADFGDIVEITF